MNALHSFACEPVASVTRELGGVSSPLCSWGRRRRGGLGQRADAAHLLGESQGVRSPSALCVSVVRFSRRRAVSGKGTGIPWKDV